MTAPMRWAQRQRLAFIGERLLSNGTVNRADLILAFGISAPQAAVDFRRFGEAHPGAMKYDNRRKAYVPDKLTARTGRDTRAAADRLMRADDTELAMILRHDPDMVRDVAAALICARSPWQRCEMCGESREGKDHSGCDAAYTEIVGHGHYP